jgi:hypothetical protein
MSDVKTDDQTPEDKTFVDKAKEAASEIDVKEIVGKAKEAASDIDVKEIAGKAKETAIDVKDRVSVFVGDHEEQIDNAIDKTGHFVDEKLTRHKFSDKIDKAQEVAKGAVNKFGHAAHEDAVPAETAAIEAGDQSEPKLD